MRHSLSSLVWRAAILSVFAVSAISWAEESPVCTVIIHPGESIQAAIDQAPDGTVICLAEGEWAEHVTIGKSITLRGEGAGRSVIQATDTDQHVVVIRKEQGDGADQRVLEVSVEGMAVAGLYGYRVGILVSSGTEVEIAGCTITRCGSGIAVEGEAQVTVSDCVISENQASPDPGFYGDGDGIGLSGNAQATITNCTILGNGNQGAVLWETSVAEISGCVIRGSRFGVVLHDSSRARIEQTQILENLHYGVCLFEGPCFSPESAQGTRFTGYMAGRENTIPGPDEQYGNGTNRTLCPLYEGAVCPADLSFLMTEAGGELDRRD